MGFGRGAIGNWSMSFWCICFAMTFIITVVELCRLSSGFPFFWHNVSVTYTCYAAPHLPLGLHHLLHLTYVQFLPDGRHRDRASPATAFSCIASVLYVIEVAGLWAWYELKEIFFL